jgi:hypothetical protein
MAFNPLFLTHICRFLSRKMLVYGQELVLTVEVNLDAL